jgi:hypothetical protein
MSGNLKIFLVNYKYAVFIHKNNNIMISIIISQLSHLIPVNILCISIYPSPFHAITFRYAA